MKELIVQKTKNYSSINVNWIEVAALEIFRETAGYVLWHVYFASYNFSWKGTFLTFSKQVFFGLWMAVSSWNYF